MSDKATKLSLEEPSDRDARAYWEELAGHPLTDEDMREIAENLTAFFDLLNELWEKQKGGAPDNGA